MNKKQEDYLLHLIAYLASIAHHHYGFSSEDRLDECKSVVKEKFNELGDSK